jgi:hypothetical protein
MIFFEKEIVIPININNHSSICVIQNAAPVATFNQNEDFSNGSLILLFLDPLDYCPKAQVCKHLRE